MNVWSISSEKGIQPQQMEYMPRMSRVSQVSATMEPTEKATLRKRTRMYTKMAARASITLMMAP